MAKKEKMEALVPVEEQPYSVPENWRWVHWGSVGKFIAGNAFKNQYQGFTEYDIPFYKVGSLKYSDSFGILYDRSNMINEEIRNILKATLIPSHSIIFAKIGEAIRLNRRSINEIPCCIDNNLMAFIPQDCEMKYVYYWSQGIDLYTLTNATTVPAIRKSDLDVIPFPLPPYEEQQRIIDRIESLFAKLDEAKEKAQTVVDAFEDRKAAILHKAFTGELTEQWRRQHKPASAKVYLKKILDNNQCFSREDFKYWENNALPDGWVESKIGNLLYYAGRIGWKGLKAEEYTESGPLFLSVYNLNDGDEVTYNHVYHISEERYLESPEIMVQEGDVLLTKDGAGIGKLGYVKYLPQEATINSSLLLIRPANAAVSKYIYYMLLGPNLQRIVKERITGSATPHLFQRDIKEFVIPVPSMEEQEEIVKCLDKMLLNERLAKESAENLIEQIDDMKNSILAKAFRGELGTNDPTELPVDIM